MLGQDDPRQHGYQRHRQPARDGIHRDKSPALYARANVMKYSAWKLAVAAMYGHASLGMPPRTTPTIANGDRSSEANNIDNHRNASLSRLTLAIAFQPACMNAATKTRMSAMGVTTR